MNNFLAQFADTIVCLFTTCTVTDIIIAIVTECDICDATICEMLDIIEELKERRKKDGVEV